jgi:hypothetical protein
LYWHAAHQSAWHGKATIFHDAMRLVLMAPDDAYVVLLKYKQNFNPFSI